MPRTRCRGSRLVHDGTFRVVVVGDSITFGLGVENNQDYPHIAEKILREKYRYENVEIVNVSRPGAGVCLYLEFIRTIVKQLKPDMLVVGFYINNDFRVMNPFFPQARRILDEVAGKGRGGALTKFYGRLVLPRLMSRFAHQVSVLSESVSGKDIPGLPDSIIGTPNQLGKIIASRGFNAKQQQRYEALKASGWVDRGLRNEVTPFLVGGAILRPNSVVDNMWLREDSRTHCEKMDSSRENHY